MHFAHSVLTRRANNGTKASAAEEKSFMEECSAGTHRGPYCLPHIHTCVRPRCRPRRQVGRIKKGAASGWSFVPPTHPSSWRKSPAPIVRSCVHARESGGRRTRKGAHTSSRSASFGHRTSRCAATLCSPCPCSARREMNRMDDDNNEKRKKDHIMPCFRRDVSRPAFVVGLACVLGTHGTHRGPSMAGGLAGRLS